MEQSELLEKARKFLMNSSSYYSTQQKRMDEDLQRFSGNFWTTELIKEWNRTDRPCEVWNLWKVFTNAIASPFSASPYHIELESKKSKEEEELQEAINKFEHNSDSKSNILNWLLNTSVTGQGFATMSVIDKADGSQEFKLEVIDDATTVALDPSVNETNASDAEEGAIVNFISLAKAKRLYGDDIVGLDYPRTLPTMCDIGTQWTAKEDSIAVVNYYYKNESGKVVFNKLCGNKVIRSDVMPYTIIPIIRMTGYKVKDVTHKTDYIGVVRATQSLQLGANIGYSTLLERMNRSPKGNFLMPVGAIEGLEEYYKIAGSRESLLYLYNGSVAPTPITESFQTQDLAETVNQSLTLMSNVLGIPLTGINGINFNDKTATEVLVQQTNAQSNVSCFYTSAYMAIRSVGRILIELYGFDAETTDFSLQNGPDIITRNAKKRQELSLLNTLLPDNMKPIIAKYMADTLDDSMADQLSADIVANMDPNLKLMGGQPEDPNAIHILNGMKATLDQTMNQLQVAMQEREELKKQVDSLTLQLTNAKAQQQLDWQKFLIQHQDEVRLKEAALMLDGKSIDNKEKVDSEKAILEGEKVALDAQKERNKVTADVMRDINSFGGV